VQGDGGRRGRPRTVGELVSSTSVPTACVFLGLILCIIASVAPWATSPVVTADGTDGDGKITIAIAAIGLIVLFARGSARTLMVLSLILVGFGVFEAIHIHDTVSGVTLFGQQVADVGWGVYALIAGSVIAFAGSWQMWRT
jgi:hypothetical protein